MAAHQVQQELHACLTIVRKKLLQAQLLLPLLRLGLRTLRLRSLLRVHQDCLLLLMHRSRQSWGERWRRLRAGRSVCFGLDPLGGHVAQSALHCSLRSFCVCD